MSNARLLRLFLLIVGSSIFFLLYLYSIVTSVAVFDPLGESPPLSRRPPHHELEKRNAKPTATSSIWNNLKIVAHALAGPFPQQPQICSRQPIIRRSKNNNSLHVYEDPLKGFFYVKVPKTASSTLAGINVRIAIRQGMRFYKHRKHNNVCSHRENHVIEPKRYYGNVNRNFSFLWGSIRDPASRALSRIFYWHISQGKQRNTTINYENDSASLIHLLMTATDCQLGAISKGQGGFQLNYLSLESISPWSSWDPEKPNMLLRPQDTQRFVQEVIKDYDFLIVTERMEESLVAMQLLRGLPVGDILSISSRVAGGYVYVTKERLDGKRCVPIQSTIRSPAVQDFLTSEKWYTMNYGDYLLYHAVNRSLDLTIQQLGKDRFETALQLFRRAQMIVGEHCNAEAVFPCSDNGTIQLEHSEKDCYYLDEGCGFPCIDKLSKLHGW